MIDIAKARKNLDERYAAKQARCRDLFTAATQDCLSIVRVIEKKYRPKKIYQWGSLLHPERFNEHSDIDLAVEGITDAETFFKMLGDVMNLTRFKLDIVQIEKMEPEFAEAVREYGKVVYEHTRRN